MTNISKICVIFSFFFIVSCSKKEEIQNQFTNSNIYHIISNGFDWSFDQDVDAKTNSGLFFMGQLSTYPFVKNYGHTLYWSDLNPSEDTYDFSEIENILNQAQQQNINVVFRLKGIVVERTPASIVNGEVKEPYVPQWVLDKHNPPTFYTLNSTDKIRVAAPWDTGIQQEYEKFIQEFSQQNFFSNNYFSGLYVHGISSSFGEEFWLKANHIQDAINAGMTENLLVQTYKDRIDWWAEAADNFKHKLIWIGYNGIHNYNREVLDDYALSKGLGWRGGGIEFYTNNAIMPPFLGQTYNSATGYVTTDWSYSLRDGNKYFGDENELLWNNVSEQTNKFMTETTIMKAAQLGMNYIWTSQEAIQLTPEMFEWFTKIAGKSPTQSPDGICWLREDYRDQFTIKNLERFVTQRDRDGYRTKNVDEIIRPKFYDSDTDIAYASRETDVANNQKGMLFFIDETFKTSITNSFKIQVYYHDENSTKWVLKFQNEDAINSSQTITGLADNLWKTAEFLIENTNLNDNNNLPDFKLEVLNDKNLKVKFVRVLK